MANAKNRVGRYPEIGKIVGEAIKHKQEIAFEKTGKPLSMATVIHDLGLSAAGLWNYQNGIRPVPKDKAQVMARYFYKGDPDIANKFLKDLDTAAQVEMAAQRSLSDRLASGDPLLVDVTDYPPFSKTLEGLVEHLCRLSAIQQKPYRRAPDFEMRQALVDKQVDLAIGYFANLYRAVRVHFWPTRIRIGLGAVILKHYSMQRSLVEEVLAGGEMENHSKLWPILVERELGAFHCRETLQYKENEFQFVEGMTAESLKAKGLADTLKTSLRTKPDKIGVVVVDEYTSFHVLNELEDKGMPVLPLSSRKAARETPRRDLPASFLSIGCSRDSELRDLLDQPLHLFLETEIESNSIRLFSLQQKLLTEVSALIQEHYPEYKPGPDTLSQKKAAANVFKAAYAWTLYVLGLDYQSIENTPTQGLPWSPILKRTREQVLSKVAQLEEEINDQITLLADSVDGPLSEEKFKELCESFDLKIKLSGVQREYVLEDRRILRRTIQNRLRDLPIGLPIEEGKEGGRIEEFKSPIEGKEEGTEEQKQKVQEKWRVLKGFHDDLKQFYLKRFSKMALNAANTIEESPAAASSDSTQQKTSGNSVDRSEKAPTTVDWAQDVVLKIEQLPIIDIFNNKGEREKQRRFGDEHDDAFLLASFGENPTRYIGSACLRPYPRYGHPGWLELFYLWVREDYRQLAVGDQIINKAKQFAQGKSKYTFLVVEVLETLNEAVTYFRKRNFVREQVTIDGRVVLKLPLSRNNIS